MLISLIACAVQLDAHTFDWHVCVRLAFTDEEAEDSAESSTDEEEEVAGEEERWRGVSNYRLMARFYTVIFISNYKTCTGYFNLYYKTGNLPLEG